MGHFLTMRNSMRQTAIDRLTFDVEAVLGTPSRAPPSDRVDGEGLNRGKSRRSPRLTGYAPPPRLAFALGAEQQTPRIRARGGAVHPFYYDLKTSFPPQRLTGAAERRR